MAKVNENPAFNGFRGKLGGVVFRNCNGNTIVAQAPGKSRRPLTEKQKMQQQRFSKATAYARAVVADPERSALLAERLMPGETLYRLAMKEHLESTKNKP